MKTVMKLFLMVTLLASSTLYASEDQTGATFARGLLATGELAGSCLVFQRQLDFQKKTQMTGSSDFFFTFWTMEAARLRMGLAQYDAHCVKTVRDYYGYTSRFETDTSK